MADNTRETSGQRDAQYGNRVGNAFDAALGSSGSREASAADAQNIKRSGNGILDRIRFAFQAALGGKNK